MPRSLWLRALVLTATCSGGVVLMLKRGSAVAAAATTAPELAPIAFASG